MTSGRAAQKKIEERQRGWRAKAGGADNLFQQLSAAFLRGFRGGSGNELAGKIRSANSSAALVVNVFQSLLESRHAHKLVTRVFDLPSTAGSLEFAVEAQFYTGAGGNPANLDLLINSAGLSLAIESKFIEPYRGLSYKDSDGKREFRPAYFSQPKRAIWKQLPSCLEEAQRIDLARRNQAPRYLRFDAPQLLKHLVGLERNLPASGTPNRCDSYRLVNLWYDAGSPEATEYREEASMFAEAIKPDLIPGRREFRLLAYQELFSRIEMLPPFERAEEYLCYLRARYF